MCKKTWRLPYLQFHSPVPGYNALLFGRGREDRIGLSHWGKPTQLLMGQQMGKKLFIVGRTIWEDGMTLTTALPAAWGGVVYSQLTFVLFQKIILSYLPLVLAMDSLSISNGNFTLDLFKKLDQSFQGQNLFFSSWSISSALSMICLGARDKTATEMARVGSSIWLWFSYISIWNRVPNYNA